MPAMRLSMRKIREILRLRALGLSVRQISTSLSASTTIAGYLRRAQAAGLCWPLREDLDDQALSWMTYSSSSTASPFFLNGPSLANSTPFCFT